MGSPNSSSKDQQHSRTKKLLPWALYAIFPIALLRLYFYPSQLSQSLKTHEIPQTKQLIITSPAVNDERTKEIPCDHSNGKWVPDNSGPLYNGTSCSTIKDGQNCMSHGRPDMGYLYWRWKPKQCKLPRFVPTTFLQLFTNKHLAFIGDSIARNQVESLLCLLSTVSPPNLTFSGDDKKFRRWHFPSHNINISIYWSPFLVKGIEKSRSGVSYNRLYMDEMDERWASDMGQFDMVVLSVGHWYLLPAVYFEQDLVLGCHYCPGLNHTEVGFYDVFRKAFKTTIKAIIDKCSSGSGGDDGGGGRRIDVVVTTFTPSHFEGEWDKAGACSKKGPYKEGEKVVEGMEAEMRKIGVEEVEVAKEKMTKLGLGSLRFEVLDVTELSLMRPDGHPGPYMYAFPFANGVSERVHNDCVHWCLPGPIDTWNEVLLEVMKRWETP